MSLIVDPSNHFKGTVTYRGGLKRWTLLKKKFSKAKLMGRAKKSQFGHFFNDNEFKFCGQVIHGLMLLKIDSSRDDEIQFLIGGSICHFGKLQFGLITGLNFVAGYDEDKWTSFTTSKRLRNEYFAGSDNILFSKLETAFWDCKNRDDIWKLGLCYFVEGILFANNNNCIWSDILSLVDVPDNFFRYPWGEKLFRRTLLELKKDIHFSMVADAEEGHDKKRKKYALSCWAPALQFWAFETITNLPQLARAKNLGAIFPRMRSWSNTISPRELELISVMDRCEANVVRPYLEPRQEEMEYVQKNKLMEVEPKPTSHVEPTGHAEMKKEFNECNSHSLMQIALSLREMSDMILKHLSKVATPHEQKEEVDISAYCFDFTNIKKMMKQKKEMKDYTKSNKRKKSVYNPMKHLDQEKVDALKTWFKQGRDCATPVDVGMDLKLFHIWDFFAGYLKPEKWLETENMEAAITLFARRIESLPHGTFLKDVILIPSNILYYFKSFWNQFSANVQQQQDHTWPCVFTDCALGKGNVPFNHGWTPESTVYTVWNINNLHWVTLAISLPDWCISVYDSKVDAGSNGSQFMEELEHIAKMIPLALATLSAFDGYPQVSERMKVTRMGHDVVPMSYTQNCGVYALKHLEHLITGTPLTKIVDEHISYFRLRLAVDIFHQKIEEDDEEEEEEGSTQSSPASCSANGDEGINSLDRPPINKVITGSTRCAMSEVALPEAEDKSDSEADSIPAEASLNAGLESKAAEAADQQTTEAAAIDQQAKEAADNVSQTPTLVKQVRWDLTSSQSIQARTRAQQKEKEAKEKEASLSVNVNGQPKRKRERAQQREKETSHVNVRPKRAANKRARYPP